MALLMRVTAEVCDATSGATFVMVTSAETATVPDGTDDGASALVAVAVLNRLGEDVLSRARDQLQEAASW
jgi:hypothetical protein